MRVAQERVYEIDFLKAVAIILVVIGHAVSYYANSSDILAWLSVFQNLIYAVHVPLFIVIAGYLCRCPKIFGGGYYWKKIKRILIPFYFFATMKLIYSNFISAEYAHGSSYTEQLLSTYLVGDVYWFCYTIFAFYLLAPLFWKCSTYVLNVILVLIIVFNTILFYRNVELTHVLQISNIVYYIFFFVLGMCLRRDENIRAIKKLLNKRFLFFMNIFMIALLLFVKIEISSMPIVSYLLAIGLMIQLYRLAIVVPKKGVVQWIYNMISEYSLQIMFLDSFNKVILFKVFSYFWSINLLCMILIIVLNLFMSCVCCKVIERIPYIAELFGLERKKIRIKGI